MLGRWRQRRRARRQSSAYRRIWQAFERYPTLADGRHDDATWRDHTGLFACCMVRIPAGALSPALDQLRAGLTDLAVARLHPDGFIHVMLQEIGFVTLNPTKDDEITPARFDELRTAIRSVSNDVGPFQMAVGGANSFQDAPFLEVRDEGACSLIHSRLRELAAVPIVPRYPYLPHVTVGHYIAELDPIPTIALLREFHQTQFGSFAVDAIELATLRVDLDYAPFEPTQIIRLSDAKR